MVERIGCFSLARDSGWMQFFGKNASIEFCGAFWGGRLFLTWGTGRSACATETVVLRIAGVESPVLIHRNAFLPKKSSALASRGKVHLSDLATLRFAARGISEGIALEFESPAG